MSSKKHLQKEIQNHLFDYLLLISGGLILIIGLLIFRGERLIEFILLLLFTCGYIIWGAYHHSTKGNLQLKIMVEYILIGFIAIYLIKALIFP